MLITDFDKVLTAQEAKLISQDNKDESIARYDVRCWMERIADKASFGFTDASDTWYWRDMKPEAKAYLESIGYVVYTTTENETKTDGTIKTKYNITVSWNKP